MVRMRTETAAVAICTVVAAVGVDRVTCAQANAEPIRLDYRAAGTCPDEAAFLARIRARTAQVRAAMPGELARTFSVTLDEGAVPSGQVQIVSVDGPLRLRRVQAGTCSEVADALALVVALALDPQSTVAAPEASTLDAPAPAPPESLSPPTAPVPTAPFVEPTPSATPESAPHRPQRARPPTRPSTSAASTDYGTISLGAGVSLFTGVSPNVLLGVSPFAGWRMATRGALDPSVRLSFFRAASGPLAAGGADAAFTWTVGRLDLCPFSFGVALRVATCGRVEAGALEVAASDIAPARDAVKPWFAAGPVVRGARSFYRWAFLDLDLGGLLRVTNDRFYFEPNTTVYRVPLVGVGAAVGLGVHFL